MASVLKQHPFGRLDVIDGSIAEGWAVNPQDDEKHEVLDVFIDGECVGTVRAGLFREDLAKESIRGGYAKFIYNIPARFHDGELHRLDLRHGDGGLSIDNVPMSFIVGDRRLPAVPDRSSWALQALVLRNETIEASFAPAVRASKRVALLSTFHKQKRFLLYHQGLIGSLIHAGFVVVVVHACSDREDWPETSFGPGCYTILKGNVGYDFGSWAVGVFALGPLLDELEEVILLNDSIIALEGAELGRIIHRARMTGADAVGVTESYERQYHLQSYMVWLGRKVCQSHMLQAFMKAYPFPSDKEEVIVRGELSFSRWLDGHDFKIACLYPYEMVAQNWLSQLDRVVAEIRELPGVAGRGNQAPYKQAMFDRLEQITTLVLAGVPVNPSHFFWDTLVEVCGCKLLKRELALLNPCHVPTHYRLGRLLADLPDARAAVLDLRQRYGGKLVPAFWTGSDAAVKQSSQTIARSPPDVRLTRLSLDEAGPLKAARSRVRAGPGEVRRSSLPRPAPAG